MSLSNTHSLGCLYVHDPYPAQYIASSSTAATAATYIIIFTDSGGGDVCSTNPATTGDIK